MWHIAGKLLFTGVAALVAKKEVRDAAKGALQGVGFKPLKDAVVQASRDYREDAKHPRTSEISRRVCELARPVLARRNLTVGSEDVRPNPHSQRGADSIYDIQIRLRNVLPAEQQAAIRDVTDEVRQELPKVTISLWT